jgi:hypothetical protein
MGREMKHGMRHRTWLEEVSSQQDSGISQVGCGNREGQSNPMSREGEDMLIHDPKPVCMSGSCGLKRID